MSLNLFISDSGTIEVEGVKFSIPCLIEALNEPPQNVLFSVKREDDQLVFTQYKSAEAAAKFFDKG